MTDAVPFSILGLAPIRRGEEAQQDPLCSCANGLSGPSNVVLIDIG